MNGPGRRVHGVSHALVLKGADVGVFHGDRDASEYVGQKGF